MEANSRRVFRILAFAGVMAVHAATSLLHYFPGAAPARNARSARWLQRWCSLLCAFFRIRIHRHGPVTETPILVSNHVSYLDILVLGSLRPLSFVAKSDVRQWPALGWLVKQAGTVFVDRSKRTDVRRVTLEIAGKVKSGVGVILFPEGTSSDGRSVLPFRNSLLEPAASSGWPVLPICISYRCSEADPAREICWWGDMTLAPHVWRLFGFREIAAHVHFGSPVLNSDRKVLGSLLHNQVASLCREASTV